MPINYLHDSSRESKKKSRKKELTPAKPKQAKVTRTANVRIPRNEVYARQQINALLDQYDAELAHLLKEGWEGQGLNDPNIGLATLRRVTKRFPAKKDLHIPPRMEDLITGRLKDCVRSQAQGMINSRCATLLKSYKAITFCRRNNKLVAMKKWQRLLAKQRRDFKCPRAPRTSHMEVDSKVVKVRDRAFPHTWDKRDPFILDFYCLWEEDAKKVQAPSNKFTMELPSTKLTRQWEEKGATVKSGMLIGRDSIDLRFEVPVIVSEKQTNDQASIDPGARKPIASRRKSGRTYIPKPDPHGHTLISIVQKCMRKQNGSKNQKDAKSHLDNFCGMTVNNLFNDPEYGMDEVGVIALEDVRHMQGTNKFFSTLPFGIQRDRIERRAAERGIKINKQTSAFRSQRCPQCGFVLDKNRQKEFFICMKCEYTDDSDDNACTNHNADLPPISYVKGRLDNKVNGFYWLPEGIITDPEKFPEVTPWKRENC